MTQHRTSKQPHRQADLPTNVSRVPSGKHLVLSRDTSPIFMYTLRTDLFKYASERHSIQLCLALLRGPKHYLQCKTTLSIGEAMNSGRGGTGNAGRRERKGRK